ncbi:MAG: hypothetical protein V4808_07065 [Pseudomonadota bacterium]
MSLRDFDEIKYRPMRRLSLTDGCNGDCCYRTGHWRGPEGLVMIYVDEGASAHTTISTIAYGRMISRTWRRPLPDKTLARVAREFAVEIKAAAIAGELI